MMRTARWIVMIGAGLFALSVLPILLYAAFGSSDGNPIGLGLLMVFGTGVAALVVGAGGVVALIASLRRR